MAAALLALWASIRTGIPILNITVTMLLPLALGGSLVTTILLPARPARRRPGTRTPRAAFARGGAARGVRRPAAAILPPAAAGPAYRIGRAPVPGLVA